MNSIPERILNFNQNRSKEMLQLKYAAMRTDPFRFLRGTCHLFYEDLFQEKDFPESPAVWICGDLHMENFGSFKGADRLVYFDLNDFDEALLGPALWELARLITSIVVAGNTLQYKKQRIAQLADAVLNGYLAQIQMGKPMTVETATSSGLIRELLLKVGSRKEKDLVKDRSNRKTDYETLITDNHRAFAVSKTDKKNIKTAVSNWINAKGDKKDWKMLDAVYRIAGTGSIGIKRYLVMLQHTRSQKKYLLDLKEALPSSLLPYIKQTQPAWKNEAERITSIQQRMQHVCPGWLSAAPLNEDWFVLKEIQPISDKVNFSGFENLPEQQTAVVRTMAQLTASAQMRSSGRQGAAIVDELIAFAGNKTWQTPLLAYANAYAARVKQDYALFCKAFDKGYFK